MDTSLTKLSRATAMLAEVRDANGAKHVMDVAGAAEHYAQKAKLGQNAIDHAHAIKIDAMRLLGEFQRKTPKHPGKPGPGRGKKASPAKEPAFVQPPTLADRGISKRLSSDSQKLAEVAEKKPHVYEQVRSGKLKVSQAVRAVVNDKKINELKTKAAAGEQSSADWHIVCGDVLTELGKLKDGTARLIFADPPYNVGIDYGDGTKADDLDDDEYMKWVGKWVKECQRVLTANGSLWLMIGDEYAAEYAVLLKRLGFTIRNWIKWYETFGVNCSNKFNRCSRHIFYAVKDPKRFVFNADAKEIRRESDRQAKYNDKRANPDGKLLDDVWQIPRIVGTADERLPDFPTQLPIELLMRVVACASAPGDTVVDPFNGSGTTGVACVQLGRKYIGIEKQAKFVDLATARLQAVKCDG